MNASLSKKRTGAAEVASELRKSIEREELQLQERLPSERILAENFGVSRGTVREALLRLEKEGKVEIRPGSGTYITHSNHFDGSDIIANARPLELIDTRFALEPHICRLSVLHGQEADFSKLEQLLEVMEENASDGRMFAEADTQFHAALVNSTRNSLLIWIISQINDVRSQDQWAEMGKVTLDDHIIKTYNTQHRLIVESLRKRDAEQAALHMKDHLETARRSLTRAAEG